MNNPTDEQADHPKADNDLADDITATANRGAEAVASPVPAAPEEMVSDGLITYTRKLTLPAVRISGESSLHTRANNLRKLEIKNNSNFSYSVSLVRVPEWLIVEPADHSLEPGQTATFALGVDQGSVPPGRNRSVGELIMQRPFINRGYPLEVSIDVEYVTPAPLINVVVQSEKSKNTLRINVRNAGGGLLQGYYYDRNRNERKTFLLANGSERQRQQDSSDSQTKPANQLFAVAIDFQDLEEVRKGILIACDCINEKFRRFEITPETYLKRELFADPPLVDFMQVEAGQSHEREIVVRHPAFREKRLINIPGRLEQHLKITQLGRGKLRLVVTDQASNLGCVADHIEFKSSSGLRRQLPIIISFKEGQNSQNARPIE